MSQQQQQQLPDVDSELAKQRCAAAETWLLERLRPVNWWSSITTTSIIPACPIALETEARARFDAELLAFYAQLRDCYLSTTTTTSTSTSTSAIDDLTHLIYSTLYSLLLSATPASSNARLLTSLDSSSERLRRAFALTDTDTDRDKATIPLQLLLNDDYLEWEAYAMLRMLLKRFRLLVDQPPPPQPPQPPQPHLTCQQLANVHRWQVRALKRWLLDELRPPPSCSSTTSQVLSLTPSAPCPLVCTPRPVSGAEQRHIARLVLVVKSAIRRELASTATATATADADGLVWLLEYSRPWLWLRTDSHTFLRPPPARPRAMVGVQVARVERSLFHLCTFIGHLVSPPPVKSVQVKRLPTTTVLAADVNVFLARVNASLANTVVSSREPEMADVEHEVETEHLLVFLERAEAIMQRMEKKEEKDDTETLAACVDSLRASRVLLEPSATLQCQQEQCPTGDDQDDYAADVEIEEASALYAATLADVRKQPLHLHPQHQPPLKSILKKKTTTKSKNKNKKRKKQLTATECQTLNKWLLTTLRSSSEDDKLDLSLSMWQQHEQRVRIERIVGDFRAALAFLLKRMQSHNHSDNYDWQQRLVAEAIVDVCAAEAQPERYIFPATSEEEEERKRAPSKNNNSNSGTYEHYEARRLAWHRLQHVLALHHTTTNTTTTTSGDSGEQLGVAFFDQHLRGHIEAALIVVFDQVRRVVTDYSSYDHEDDLDSTLVYHDENNNINHVQQQQQQQQQIISSPSDNIKWKRQQQQQQPQALQLCPLASLEHI